MFLRIKRSFAPETDPYQINSVGPRIMGDEVRNVNYIKRDSISKILMKWSPAS
jgi:hypothetical protein